MRAFLATFLLALVTGCLAAIMGYVYILLSGRLDVRESVTGPIIIFFGFFLFIALLRLILGWVYKIGYDGGPQKWVSALGYLVRNHRTVDKNL